jgi:hypothetical protein
MKHYGKKFGALAFVLIAVFCTTPRHAHAQLEVNDPFNLAEEAIAVGQETTNTSSTLVNTAENAITSLHAVTGINLKTGLDGIAWAVAKMAIQSMTQSMVNWINSGFNGSPSFVGDLQTHLENVGFVVANSFVSNLLSQPSIRSPFQNTVAALTQLNYLAQTSQQGYFLQNAYSLNKYAQNDVAFLNGNFSQGGWSGWFALSQPQNNVYGASFLATDQLARLVMQAQMNATTQLNWGQGFLSWCGGIDDLDGTNDRTIPATGNIIGIDGKEVPNSGLPAIDTIDTSKPNTVQSCQKSDGTPGQVQTPGSVIQGQLNKTLGLSGDTLVTASEFNQVIGALIGQLVNQVVGATGLFGVSQPSSATQTTLTSQYDPGNGSSILDQATNPSQYASSTNIATADLSSSLSKQISDEKAQITQYQIDWQTISNEASIADASLTTCSLPPEGAVADVKRVKDAAAIALKKAASGLTTIAQIENTANAALATQNNPGAVATAATSFQNFVSSDAAPSPTEIAQAHSDAKDDSQSTSIITASAATITNASRAKMITDLLTRTLFGQMLEISQLCSVQNTIPTEFRGLPVQQS